MRRHSSSLREIVMKCNHIDMASGGSTEFHDEAARRGRGRVALGLLLGVALFLSISPRVHGTSIPWGDPVLGHSWDQLWVEESDRSFDSLKAAILLPPDSTFESPGFFGFSAGSWTVQSITAREITAQGAATTRLEFSTHFNGNPWDY